MNTIIGLGYMSFFGALASTGDLLMWSFIGFSSVLIFVASIDVPFQLWNHNKQLKMTMQEVKDEMKESEGRPEVKSQIRRMQRQLSEQRMMDSVPMADVIITNPTHYAVAISYPRDAAGVPTLDAPIVVAKGVDFMAQRIKKVARENGVLCHENRPLARALHADVEVGQPIPEDLYAAMATVLAHVYRADKAVAPALA